MPEMHRYSMQVIEQRIDNLHRSSAPGSSIYVFKLLALCLGLIQLCGIATAEISLQLCLYLHYLATFSPQSCRVESPEINRLAFCLNNQLSKPQPCSRAIQDTPAAMTGCHIGACYARDPEATRCRLVWHALVGLNLISQLTQLVSSHWPKPSTTMHGCKPPVQPIITQASLQHAPAPSMQHTASLKLILSPTFQ